MKKFASEGAVAIEACVTVTLFMLLMFFFLGVFMIFMAQSMVAHVAMQTAESLAMDAWQIEKVQLTGISDASVGRIVVNGILELTGQSEEKNPNYVTENEWWTDKGQLEDAISSRFLGYLTGGDEERAIKFIKAVKINIAAGQWSKAFDFSDSKIESGDLYVTIKYKLDYMFQIWGLENGVAVEQTAVSHLWMSNASSVNLQK